MDKTIQKYVQQSKHLNSHIIYIILPTKAYVHGIRLSYRIKRTWSE